MVHIYEGHLGSLYWTEEYEEPEYCEQCGDSDWYKGAVSSKSALYKLFDGEIDVNGSGGWDSKYFEEFANGIPWEATNEPD